MSPRATNIAVVLVAAAVVVAGIALVAFSFNSAPITHADAEGTSDGVVQRNPDNTFSVDLTASQLNAIKIEPVELREFPVEKEAVGSIDFNEDMETQVFSPYQGKIIGLFAEIGDDVKKGQTLFTIDSPDLLQAESNLISAAGVLDQTTRVLARAQELYNTHAISQAELELDVSNQQTAEGALRTGRDAVRIFGKSDAEIDKIIAARAADPTLVVASPVDGRVTARDAAPGLLVQPGNPPAPYTVADTNTMWMLANVADIDSPAFRVGQRV